MSAITAAVSETGAAGPGDMGKVMALLKPKLAGRADMSEVSKLIKALEQQGDGTKADQYRNQLATEFPEWKAP